MLGGVRIAYRDRRPEPAEQLPGSVPVILVHGMGGDGTTWDRFADELVASGRRVIVPDLRGHGRSAHTDSYMFGDFAADILALIDHLGLATSSRQRVDLVGHSLGGYAVSLIAQQRPSLVRRLVIEECPLPMRDGDPPASLTGRFPSPEELWHAATSLLRHPRAVLAFDRSMTPSALTQFRTPNQPWWDGLPMITARTLVLCGGKGGMVNPVKVAAMAEAMPDCRVIRFACGHSIHRDRYNDFRAAVVPFLMPDPAHARGRQPRVSRT